MHSVIWKWKCRVCQKRDHLEKKHPLKSRNSLSGSQHFSTVDLVHEQNSWDEDLGTTVRWFWERCFCWLSYLQSHYECMMGANAQWYDRPKLGYKNIPQKFLKTIVKINDTNVHSLIVQELTWLLLPVEQWLLWKNTVSLKVYSDLFVWLTDR